MGYGLFRALLGVPGLLAPVAREIVHELVPSVGGTGPHGLTVRLERIRLPRQSVHRIPRSTFVTMAKRPLANTGRRDLKHDFRFSERQIFLRNTLDMPSLKISQVICPSCRGGNIGSDGSNVALNHSLRRTLSIVFPRANSSISLSR